MTTLEPQTSDVLRTPIRRRHGVYANSLFTMFQTASLAVFGFAFWLVAARHMSAGDVGAAAGLLAAANLVNNLGVIGMSTVVVRFLPRSADPESMASSLLTLVLITSTVVAIAYALSTRARLFGDDLLIGPWSVLAFGFLAIAETTNPVFSAIHTADRASWRNAFVGTASGATRLLALLTSVALGSAGGATRSFCAAAAVTIVLHLFLLRRSESRMRLRLRIVSSDVRPILRFAAGSHAMTLVGGIPTLLLPLVVATRLGRDETAYFVMTMTLATFVFLVPTAIGQNVLASASHDDGFTAQLLRKTVRCEALSTAAAVVLMGAIGPTVLSFYGAAYRSHGQPLLWWLLASTPLVVGNGIFGVVLLVEKRIARLVAVNAVNAVVVVVGCSLFAHDLRTIGLVWLVGEVANFVLLLIASSSDLRLILSSNRTTATGAATSIEGAIS